MLFRVDWDIPKCLYASSNTCRDLRGCPYSASEGDLSSYLGTSIELVIVRNGEALLEGVCDEFWASLLPSFIVYR